MPLNMIILGACGRMGRTIQGLLRARPAEFEIAYLVVREEELDVARQEFTKPVTSCIEEALSRVENAVLIDFTSPESTMIAARACAKHGARHVIGTTGLTEIQKSELTQLAAETPILLSPNMSVGVNVLLKILPELTRMLGSDYDVELAEIHHKMKVDSPSGTAMRLGEALAEAKGWSMGENACYHREGIVGARPKEQIGMQTLRGGDVVGVHTVYYLGPGERIEVAHHAHSRENFAQGALRAAQWLSGQGAGSLYSFMDVLGSD